MIRLMFLMVMIVVLLAGGLANLQVVEFRTIFTEDVRASLSFLLLGAFALGFVCSTLLSLMQAMRTLGRQRGRRSEPLPEDYRPSLPPPPMLPLQPDVGPRETFGSRR